MGAGLFGLGKPQPSRFPYPGRPQPSPGVAPSQGIVTRANSVIVFGPSGTPVGVFVYQPGTTPARGNPPIAWMTAATADPFGNALPGGLQVGSQNTAHTQFAGLTTGQLALSGAATQFAPGLVQASANAVLTFSSGTQSVSDNAAIASLYSRLAAVAASLGTTALALFSELVFASSGLKVQGGATVDSIKSAAGMSGTIGVTQTDITEITNAVATQVTMTNTWAIPANDPQAGTVYRLVCGGWGTQATTTAVGLTVNVLAFTHVFAGNAMSAATIPAGATFHWRYEVDLIIVTTGAAGTARASGRFTWNQAATPGAHETVATGQTSSSDISPCDTTSAASMRMTSTWASITGSPSLTCMYSTFERIGP